MKKDLVSISMIMLCFMLFGCDTMNSDVSTSTKERIVVEHVMLPAQFQRADGAAYTVNLDTIIARPDDNQVHPLALINHGYDPVNYQHRYIDDFKYQTMEFARRGWVAVAFSRRGYGHSGGDFAEKITGCDEIGVFRGATVPSEDIRAVLHLMAQHNYVDSSKVIAVGHSGGGLAMIALAAKPPPGLLAAINFAGAINATFPAAQDCYSDILIKVVTKFGKSTRIPMLWIYAENDFSSPMALGKRMYTAFKKGGGNAEFITEIWYGTDGHNLFFQPESMSIWTPYVDAFLQKNGLQQRDNLIPVRGAREVINAGMEKQ
jgi:dienelactone hydrolase